MRRLPGLILFAGVLGGAALVVLHVAPGFFGLLAALAVSAPYTGRRKAFLVSDRALVSEVLMIEYVSVAVWLAVIIAEVPALSGVQRGVAVVCAALLLAYGLLLWWRPPMLTVTAEGVTRRVFLRATLAPAPLREVSREAAAGVRRVLGDRCTARVPRELRALGGDGGRFRGRAMDSAPAAFPRRGLRSARRARCLAGTASSARPTTPSASSSSSWRSPWACWRQRWWYARRCCA